MGRRRQRLDRFGRRQVGQRRRLQCRIDSIGDALARVSAKQCLRPSWIASFSVNAGNSNRREALYRDDHPPVPVQGREVILVDDGHGLHSSRAATAD